MVRRFHSPRAIEVLLLGVGIWLSGLASYSLAQQAAGYAVNGTVLDSVTKQPIGRALVQLGGDAVLTDNSGNFEIQNVVPGQQTLMVRRPGFVGNQGMHGMQPSQDQVSSFPCQAGPEMPPLTLQLTPEAIVSGRISMTDSDIEDGTQIIAYRKTVDNGRSGWQMAGMATTNSDGVFRIASLSSGIYLFYAQPETDRLNVPSDDAPSSGYAAAYYPGVADPAAAGTLTLSPGEHKQADFALTRRAFYPVTIRVANGRPGDYDSLQILDIGGMDAHMDVRFDPAQQVGHAHLPAGRYQVAVRTFNPGNSGAPLVGIREFTVSAGSVTNVSVSVLPMGSVPVTIRKEFTASTSSGMGRGEVVPFSRFGSAVVADPGVNVSLIDAEAQFSGGGNYAGGLERVPGSNDETAYQIKNVSPGKYWVEADAYGGYVSSITSGGVDLARDMLTVGDGGSSAPIEITLRNDAGSIEGMINPTASPDDGQKHDTWIYAIPMFPSASALQSVNASSTGSFSFESLPPGAYRVVAFDSPQQIEFHNPAAFTPLSVAGQAVTVEPGGKTQVRLDITHSEQSP